MLLFVALLAGFVLRFGPIFPNNFSFLYDNAKDSLAMLHMWTAQDPVFLGPVTSIDGVYNGPLWYYIALPVNILFSFHPVASVLTIILLALVSIYLAYRAFGPLGATLFATSTALVGSQQTAWAPNMTPLITFPLLLLLMKRASLSKISTLQVIGIAFLTSLFFHTQAAFGVVMAPLVVICLWHQHVTLSVKQILLGVTFFLLPFMFHGLFEIKNDFRQTKELIFYFQNYKARSYKLSPNQPGLARIPEIAGYVLGQGSSSFSPIQNSTPLLGVAVLLLLVAMKNFRKEQYFVLLVLIIGTFLSYLVIPAKPYYFVGIVPVWIVLFLLFVRDYIPKYTTALLLIFWGFSVVTFIGSRNSYLIHSRESSFLYGTKELAVVKAYELAKGQPFTLYSYVPDVYDYPFQHIIRTYAARKGLELPKEFSYMPGEFTYVPNKTGSQVADTLATRILIVEPYVNQEFYEEWWDMVTDGYTLKATESINNATKVHVLTKNL